MKLRTLIVFVLLVAAGAGLGVVPSTSSSVGPYTCNGSTTVFAVPFKFLTSADLIVQKTGVATGAVSTLRLTTDYTVAGAGMSSGGSITLTSAANCAAGFTLSVKRSTAKTQPTSLRSSSAYNAATVESALDRQTFVTQELGRDQDAAISAALTASASSNSAAISAAAAAAAVAAAAAPGNGTLVTPTGATRADSLANRHAREVWVTDFTGIDPTGSSSSTSAVQAAVALAVANGSTLRFPAGTFVMDATLATTNIEVRGEGPEKTIVWFYGSGDAARFYTAKGAQFSGIRLVSKGAGQNGLRVNGEFAKVSNVRIEEFDGTALPVDVAFYSDIRNVNIRNITTQGAKGVSVLYAANGFEDVVVTGRFTTMVEVAGNKNVWIRGNVNPDTQGTGVTNAFLVSGTHNEFRSTYYELVTGSGTPTNLINFTSASNSNDFSALYFASLYDTGGGVHSGVIDTLARIVDAGFANSVNTRPIGYNYQVFPSDVGSQNLLPNSGFDAWGASTLVPYGWANMAGTGTLARETTVVHGTRSSLKVTGANEDIAIGGFVTTPTPAYNSLNQIPIAFLRGKMVTAGVWAYSTQASCGNLRILANGTAPNAVGSMNHTGGGGWELLTAMMRVPTDATQLGVQFRSNASTGVAKLTGDLYFSEPFLVPGTVLPHYSPRPLTDAVAQMAGPFAFAPPTTPASGTTTPSAADGNAFKLNNATGATITNFTNGKQGQEIVIWDPNANSTLANTATIATVTGAATGITAKPRRLILDGTVWREF